MANITGNTKPKSRRKTGEGWHVTESESQSKVVGTMTPAKYYIQLDKDQVDALKDFICRVYLMRGAQKSWEVAGKAKYLASKKRYEKQVDNVLNILVPKSKDNANG